MIQSLALLFIPFSLFLVVNMEFFGALHITAISVLGGVLSLLGAVILLLLPLPNFEVCVGKVGRVECVSFIFSLLVIYYFVFVISVYGPPPTWGVITGSYVDPESLYGNYSRFLPLRVTVTSVVLAQGLMIWIFLPKQSTILHSINGALTLISFILVAVIMEVRQPILWFMLYYICYRFHSLKAFIEVLLTRKMLFLIVAFIAIWQVFVMAGSVRTGLDPTDFLATELARSFRMDPAYWYLPGAFIWAIIYLFGGFARGIDIGRSFEYFNLILNKDLFPGFLQFIPEDLGLQAPIATDRFAEQAMAIDAFHQLCLTYGVVFGIALFLIQIFLFSYIVTSIRRKLHKGQEISYIEYMVFLWLGVRILLLPIGTYFLSFSSAVELVVLCFFGYLAKIKARKKAE